MIKLYKKQLFIAPSSFNKKQKIFIDLQKNKKLSIKLNPIKKKLSENQILEYAKDATHIIAGTEKYTANTLKKLKKLRYIFRLGSGIDNLDHKYLKSKKITFEKSSVSLGKAVGELVIGLALTNLRNISKHDNDMKNNNWKKIMGNL